MTREHKLALLIGFALVLIVGVVVSDHFSGARSARLGEVVDEHEEGRRPIGGGLTTRTDLLAADPLPTPHGVGATVAELETQLVPEQVESNPGRPVSGREALADAVRSGLSRLEESIPVIEMGAAPVTAQTDRRRSASEVDLHESALPEEPVAAPANWRRASQWPGPALHNVGRGETLWAIAEQHYGDGALHTKLAEYNRDRLAPGGVLRAGATLLIPVRAELMAGAEAPSATTSTAPIREPAGAEATTRRHTVQRGETLGEISQKLLGTSRRWREIHELNRDVISNPDNVPAGVVLRIPAR